MFDKELDRKTDTETNTTIEKVRIQTEKIQEGSTGKKLLLTKSVKRIDKDTVQIQTETIQEGSTGKKLLVTKSVKKIDKDTAQIQTEKRRKDR